ncbi:MAG: GNAT family N-acetyltransferase [Alphaproteobacteria bacterium]|nr:GNAT family N-acetyltransferase [Alphaproteobacteria bacterium]MDD9920378.1 GNAT family N-acetyltransferase [Alphaproteobacteria bacterium]
MKKLPEGYEIRAVSYEELAPYVAAGEAEIFAEDDWYFDIPQILKADELEKIAKLKENYKNLVTFHYAAFYKGELVGWSYGRQSSIEDNLSDYYIYSTFVYKPHRRNGLYTKMLEMTIGDCAKIGIQTVFTHHTMTNNPVIIAGLKAGFVITGTHFTDGFGTNVQLSYYTNKERRRLLDIRMGHDRPNTTDFNVMGIK